MPPVVSIIMNCLDCAKDLPQALASIAAQTFTDWEIIFWDNGSTDDSATIAKAFGPKLRYFFGETTVPLGQARNLAIAQARGEFIAFLDCDDLWKKEKLQKQLELFKINPRVGLVCTDTEIYDGKHVLGKVFRSSHPARGNAFSQLMQRQWISMSSAMARRAALDSLLLSGASAQWFDPAFELCEEADVFYRIDHDWELDYVPEALTVWRVHGNNSTFRNFAKFADETLAILEKHRKLYPGYEEEHRELVELLQNRAAFQKAVALWRAGKNREARQALGQASGKSLKMQAFWLASFLPGSAFDVLSKLYFSLPASWRR